MVVKIGSHRCAEKHPTVLSAQLTRDRMMARYMNAMSDTPAPLYADKKRLSGSGYPDGAFGVLAEAERTHPLEVREDRSMQQCSVAVHLEREKPISKRFRDQQILRTCDCQSVRMRNAVGNCSNITIRRRQKNPSRRKAVGSGSICVERRHICVSIASDDLGPVDILMRRRSSRHGPSASRHRISRSAAGSSRRPINYRRAKSLDRTVDLVRRRRS